MNLSQAATKGLGVLRRLSVVCVDKYRELGGVLATHDCAPLRRYVLLLEPGRKMATNDIGAPQSRNLFRPLSTRPVCLVDMVSGSEDGFSCGVEACLDVGHDLPRCCDGGSIWSWAERVEVHRDLIGRSEPHEHNGVG
jgi:hypothetical protein